MEGGKEGVGGVVRMRSLKSALKHQLRVCEREIRYSMYVCVCGVRECVCVCVVLVRVCVHTRPLGARPSNLIFPSSPTQKILKLQKILMFRLNSLHK